ncbi:hypothetical protein [Actinokineospora sp. NPDC004072]
MREGIGLLLCIQAVGGGLSALLDGSRSWFLQRYIVPEAVQVPASVVMLGLGLVLLWSAWERNR